MSVSINDVFTSTDNYSQLIEHSQSFDSDTLGSKGVLMISYEPFYNTLLKKGITEYELIYKHGLFANTINRMKHNKPITTTTLDTLCFILSCSVSDILLYKEDT